MGDALALEIGLTTATILVQRPVNHPGRGGEVSFKLHLALVLPRE